MYHILLQMGPDKAEKADIKLQQTLAILASSDAKIRDDVALVSYYGVSPHEFATYTSDAIHSRVQSLALRKLKDLELMN